MTWRQAFGGYAFAAAWTRYEDARRSVRLGLDDDNEGH